MPKQRVEVVVYEAEPVQRPLVQSTRGFMLGRGLRMIGNEDLAANAAWPGYVLSWSR